MTFGSMLYKLFIGPLELMFEVIFAIADRIIGNHGFTIIILSLAINFLVLPLYRRADAMQREEREITQKMRPGVAHIKKTFKGNERFMMLQTFYRQHHYKQTDVFKGSVSLLLQVPFFTAAYRFLSGLELLRGMSFGPIADMGAPDGLLRIGGLTLNLLPILMTAINYVSASIYMKGFPLKSKLQTYGLAIVFLVLLYSSPAGLVFYWTLNNLFSLLKNIFYKLKHPRLVLSVIFSALGLAGIVYVLGFCPTFGRSRKIFLLLVFAALQLPLLTTLLKKKKAPAPEKAAVQPSEARLEKRIFLLASLFLTILTGALIPSAIINDSTPEFVQILSPKSPLLYLLNALLLAAGTFLVWLGIFFRLSSARGKKLFAFGATAACCVAAANYLFFGTGYGNLSSVLVYDDLPVARLRDILLNLVVIAALTAMLFLIWKKKRMLLSVFAGALCFAVAGMSIVNAVEIQKTYRSIVDHTDGNEEQFYVPLSKNGKNVVVIMLDRAIGRMVPYLVEEKPELKQLLDGFTLYPNTLSYGIGTNTGSPAVFGGYEYTPEAINARSDLTLAEKQNEALRLMPVLFANAGYEVSVADPPYAGYRTPADLSIFDDYPEMHTYHTMSGQFNINEKAEQAFERLRNRNFFCYSLFKISPLFVQNTLYDHGDYNRADAGYVSDGEDGTNLIAQTMDGVSKSVGVSKAFMDSYSVISHMKELTAIRDSANNTFLIMDNEATHYPMLLQEPEYIPAVVVDNTAYDAAHAVRSDAQGNTLRLDTPKEMVHYQSNMAALLRLGAWFNYLRENGVYDNTRIILVADHGRNLGMFPELSLKMGTETNEDDVDALYFQPLLMVKDFGATGFSVDESFMTNADTPLLAMAGLIENPVNPATGKPVEASLKDAAEQHVFCTEYWNPKENHGNMFRPDRWFAVHDDVRDPENWSYLGVH